MTTHQNGKHWKFLISGKDPAFLELVDILKQIGDLCQKYHMRNIFFCNFQALMINQTAIKRCFKNIVIQINLVNTSPVTDTRINESGGAREKEDEGVAKHGDDINGDIAVNKIKFSNKVEGDAKENNPRDQVNIMTENEKYREKFKLLVDETDKIE